MRSSRVLTGGPPLRADDARNDRVACSAPFPPPELPGFVGTMALSDFSDAVSVPRLFASSRLPGPPRKKRSRSVGDLKGCDVIRLSNAIGSSTPGAHEALAIDALHDVAFGNCDHLGASIRNTLSGLNPIHGRAATPVHSTSSAFSPSAPTTSSPLPPLGSIRGALARAYLGGIRPRLMSSPSPFAPQVPCWLVLGRDPASGARSSTAGSPLQTNRVHRHTVPATYLLVLLVSWPVDDSPQKIVHLNRVRQRK